MACNNLALMYFADPEATKADIDKARALLGNACTSGYATACANLAERIRYHQVEAVEGQSLVDD